MDPASSRAPTVLIHVGTHKTGTTSIQRMLADNEAPLTEAGLFVPRTGRLDPAFGAHHNVAFELCHSYMFDAGRGTFADLLSEIAHCHAPRVCISSEEFEVFEANRGALRKLHDGIRSIGYVPIILVYLRPQVDYIESLYAQLARDGKSMEFRRFLKSIVRKGRFLDSRLNYSRLLEEFAEVFGSEHIIVRRYRNSDDTTSLLRDFLSVALPSSLLQENLTFPERLNPKTHFGFPTPDPTCGTKFDERPVAFEPLSLAEILGISLRFGIDNALVRKRYGALIAPVTRRRFKREVLALLRPDATRVAARNAFRSAAAMNDGANPSGGSRLISAIGGARRRLLAYWINARSGSTARKYRELASQPSAVFDGRAVSANHAMTFAETRTRPEAARDLGQSHNP